MARAVRAIIAINALPTIAFVRVALQMPLCDPEIALGDDLVEAVGAAADVFAGVAVAEDVRFLGHGGFPGGLAAVAGSCVGGHGDVSVLLGVGGWWGLWSL